MAIRLAALVSAGILSLLLMPSGWAQSGDDVRTLTKEVEALKAGQAAIKKELQEIKSLLQQRGQVARAPAGPAGPEIVDIMVSVDGASIKGDKTAKVTMVEFTDYQCPFCSRYYRQTWPELERDYVNTGKVKLALRALPLESIHPQAFKAAEASYCAGAQGKFWEMHDRLFASRSTLARKDLSAHAQTLGLDVAAFDECLDGGAATTRIRQDLVDADKAGAKATPTFFIGLTDPDSAQVKAVRVIRGARPYKVFKEAIDSLLGAPE